MKQTGMIERCLQEMGFAIVPVNGTSMWPLLKEGKRVEVVAKKKRMLHKGDVVLYRRPDGTLVLHRIVKISGKDSYLVCGDHQWKVKEQIQEKQILAIARGFYRNGRYIDESTRWYRLYKRCWTRHLILRRGCLAFLRLSGIEKKHFKR